MHTSSGFLSLYPLRLPRRLYAAIRKGEAAARALPREDLSPAALWLEDHARFLAEEAQALGRQLQHPGAHLFHVFSVVRNADNRPAKGSDQFPHHRPGQG